MAEMTTPSPAPAPAPVPAPPRRRWLRIALAVLALLAVLLGGALWLLGRESTLQQIVQRVASASGGQIAVTGVSGSLYGRMHVDRIVHTTPESVLTVLDVTIDWSPWQYFSEGIAISTLHAASAVQQTLKEGPPATLPATLAPPFRLALADARLNKLTLVAIDGGKVQVDAIRFKLEGDAEAWRLSNASALTPLGRADASGAIGAQRPFAVNAKASLTQSATESTTAGQPAPSNRAPAATAGTPARLALDVRGNLSLLEMTAKGTSSNANGGGTLALAPFDPVMLRALDLQAQGVNPALFNPAWPQAELALRLQAQIAADRHIKGLLALENRSASGPLDQHRVPLRSVGAKIGGTLTVTTLDDVTLDLGAAGRFDGSGRIQRADIAAGIDAATLALTTAKLDLHGLHGALHPTKAAGTITMGSTGARQTVTIHLADANLKIDAQAVTDGAQLLVKQARLSAGKGSVQATLSASLKDKQAFTASAAINRFDPSLLVAAPRAELSGSLQAAGALAPAWQVDAAFKLENSRLLGQPLSGNGKLHADARHISNIDVQLALARNTAQLRGAFGLPDEQLLWQADARQLSAFAPDLAGAVAANGAVTGSYAAPRSTFTVEARGLALPSARPPAQDSLLRASGDVALAGGGVQVKASGTAQKLDPAAFGPYGLGNINGHFTASYVGGGNRGPIGGNRAVFDVVLQPSTYSGAPLAGYAKGSVEPGAAPRLAGIDVDLKLGPNSARVQGAFGAARDRLDWNIDAPRLAVLGPDFSGVVRGAGVLTGTLAQPAANFSLDGSEVRLFARHQLKSIKASAAVGTGLGGNDPITSNVTLAGYTSPGLSLNQAVFSSTGTRAAHVLQLSASNADFDAQVKVRGGSQEGVWNGVIETLHNKGRFALALQGPAALRLAAPAGSGIAGLTHPEQMVLSGAALRLPEGAVRIDVLEKHGARWTSRGAATGVPASYLAQLSSAWRDNIVSDLSLGASWALDLQRPPGAAPALAGEARIYREKGDLVVVGASDKPVTLGLRKLEARANVAGGALRMAVELDGLRAGQARINATTQLVDGRIAGASPLAFDGNVNLASIAWLAPLAGMPGLELDGALKVIASGSGTVADPVLQGDAVGERLVVNWADQGIKLRNGQLQANFAGDKLNLQRLAFDGDRGSAKADGWVRFAGGDATMQLALAADQLQVLSRPDRILVLSGQAALVRDQKHFQLDGKLKAERANLELAADNAPTISEDVVIVGRNKPGQVAAPAAQKSLPLNVDMEADLGDDFRLKGKGIDAQLAGMVRVRIQDRRPPRATGSIRVVSGTYAAYGQKLTIARGVLNFTGAYDNPGLNILAVRKRPEGEQLTETNVEAGVEVRGTALAPQAKLVSTPSVPDSEKLAWLVLGHGLADAGGNEMALLGTAAGALFGGSGSGIAGKLGLDELGLSQAQNGGNAKGLENTVVTVGKRLSSRAYLSFEQGAGSATSLVKLRYKLNPRITLQLQTGTNNALDVLYTWAFD
jgi:translocation and assembly module TamB